MEKKHVSTSVLAWKAVVNKALPLYKATKSNRGVPSKFEKLWGGWINDKTTVSD